jgi:hypothetical protein
VGFFFARILPKASVRIIPAEGLTLPLAQPLASLMHE